MTNKQFQKQILQLVKDNGGRISVGALHERLKPQFKQGDWRPPHQIRLLQGQGKLWSTDEKLGITSSIELTEKGYLTFAKPRIRFWNWFSNDFAKVISLIALILSLALTAKELFW